MSEFTESTTLWHEEAFRHVPVAASTALLTGAGAASSSRSGTSTASGAERLTATSLSRLRGPCLKGWVRLTLSEAEVSTSATFGRWALKLLTRLTKALATFGFFVQRSVEVAAKQLFTIVLQQLIVLCKYLLALLTLNESVQDLLTSLEVHTLGRLSQAYHSLFHQLHNTIHIDRLDRPIRRLLSSV